MFPSSYSTNTHVQGCHCTRIMVNLRVYRHHWAEDDSWRHLWQDANQCGHNLICACISCYCLRQYCCTCIMVSLWVQQHHEQRMVLRGSNKRLTHKTIAYAKKLNTSLLRGSPVCIHICSSLSYLVIGMRWPLLTNTERNTHMYMYTVWLGSSSVGFKHLMAHLASGSPFLGL